MSAIGGELFLLVYPLIDSLKFESTDRSDLQCALATMHSCISPPNCSGPGLGSNEFVDILLNVATFEKYDSEEGISNMSFEDFRSWCTLLPSVRKFFGSLLMPCNPGYLTFHLFFALPLSLSIR